MTLQEALLDGRVVWFPTSEEQIEALRCLKEDPRFALSPLLQGYINRGVAEWRCVYCKDLVSHMGVRFSHPEATGAYLLYASDCYAGQTRTSYHDLVPVCSEPPDLAPDLDLSTLLGGETS